ncbi:MAG TPA: protein kinase, partial [Polyangiaceae bacterium]|nr:protein kinase [Polyangiaceae bacterium]
MPPTEADELVGQTLNNTYVIESIIGEGGMGRVYRARHTRISQKQFALKVVRPEYTRNSEIIARFRREAEAAACVSNPNVVGVYDVGRTDEGWEYMVCDYLDGVDLAAHIEKVKRVGLETAVHIAVRVAEGLEAAHEAGVIHRDMKPHNIFLLRDSNGFIGSRPEIKVLDFGLSRFQDAGDTALTKTGVIMGTPAYMAPEQARGERVDSRADVYGAGAILYVALTGQPPFKDETIQLIVLQVLGKDPVRPRALNPDIPETLELVIQRAMAKNPDERYQTMAEFRRALEPFVTETKPALLPGARSPMQTRNGLGAEAHEVASARTRLVLFTIFAVAMVVFCLASAATGIELLTGKVTLTPTELGLLLLGIVGTSLTPAVLLILRVKSRVWDNNARVLEALERVRGPVLMGLIAYGLGGIAIRLFDDVVGRFAWQDVLAAGDGVGWPGWNLLLPLIAFLTAGATVLRRRWVSGSISTWRHFLLGGPYVTLSALLCGVVLYLGFLWRAHGAPTARTLTPEPVQQPAPPTAAAEKPRPVLPKAQDTLPVLRPTRGPIKRASSDELVAAMSRGADGLLPLSERYPEDPAVLKPLILAFASRATTLADAMAVTQRLFAAAPEEILDPDLRFLIRRGAVTPGQSSKLAFELMTNHMGTSGLDLLYDLWLTSPKISARAKEALDDPRIQARFSPALAIAYDLRKAEA